MLNLVENGAAAVPAYVRSVEDFSLELVSVVEAAAVAAARTIGRGDAHASDHAAVEAMRRAFEDVGVHGRIVIGEGERDEAPMLHIGEIVGGGARGGARPAMDIAVDPLEGTNLCAAGAPNALAVLAASEPGGLLHAPDCYMEKIMAGPACRGALDLDAPVADNLSAIAASLGLRVADVVVAVLERPRHSQLIADIRRAGARIWLIPDGDLSAGIATSLRGSAVHAVMGSGGAPEGVLTAAALRCVGGEMLGRLVAPTGELRDRLTRMGIGDPDRIYTAQDLAPGRQLVFAACGVTGGALLKRVRFFHDGYRTHSFVVCRGLAGVRYIESSYTTQ